MLVYTATKMEFLSDVSGGVIVDKIKEKFDSLLYVNSNKSEVRSWQNSLIFMHMVLCRAKLDNDVDVAIEYQIPFTSKRVDFIIGGKDDKDKENVIIIELKQWDRAQRTSREALVITYFEKRGMTATSHPSYQAYTYAKTIENYNETIRDEKINLKPCAYLHNYDEKYREEIDNDLYIEYIKEAPLFLKKDAEKLRDFIDKYVKKKSEKILYKIDHGKIKPSKALQDAISSMMKGNKEFYLLDEQKVVYSTIKRLIEKSKKDNNKYTIIVEGGPGTGKSVVAINLIADFRDLKISYVSKNAAVREVMFEKLKRDKIKLSYVKSLFKGSGSFVNSIENDFDCLVVDEAHRLNEKSGLFANKGENQIKEIIRASKVSVFFIDEDQIVTTKDIGKISEITKWANHLNAKIFSGEEYKLSSQFRCNGSDGYIAFLDDLLEIRNTANKILELDYDMKVFNDPNEMKKELEKKNKINNKARMLAGYCYDWITKSNPNDENYDIYLENDFKAKWNFNNTKTWAIDEDSFDQIGCIHTSQGLEFDYVGVIIGKDLRFENGKVVSDYSKRAKTDRSLRGIKKAKNFDLADIIIRNTYRTLMTRGQKGCYIYCEDEKLSEYINKRISILI